jgi:hypothetical protein
MTLLLCQRALIYKCRQFMYNVVEKYLQLILIRILRPRIRFRRIPKSLILSKRLELNLKPDVRYVIQTFTEKPRNSNRSLHGLPSTPKQVMNLLFIADIDLLC